MCTAHCAGKELLEALLCWNSLGPNNTPAGLLGLNVFRNLADLIALETHNHKNAKYVTGSKSGRGRDLQLEGI